MALGYEEILNGKEIDDTFFVNEENIPFLLRAIEYKKYNFFAPHIVALILKKHDIVNQKIYNQLINKIFASKNIALSGIKGKSYLFLALDNENLMISKDLLEFIKGEIYDSFDLRKVKNSNVIRHGEGCLDIRFMLIKNKYLSKEEKSNIINEFYNDNEFIDLTNTLFEKIKEFVQEYVLPISFDNAEDIYKINLRRITKGLGEDSAIKLIKQIELLRLIKKLRKPKKGVVKLLSKPI